MRTLYVYDRDGNQLESFPLNDLLSGSAVSPSGALVVGLKDGGIFVWDTGLWGSVETRD